VIIETIAHLYYLLKADADTSYFPWVVNSLHSSLQTGHVEGKASGSTARKNSRTSWFAYKTCNPALTKHKFWSFGWSVTLLDNNNGNILQILLKKIIIRSILDILDILPFAATLE
jgi:hypothetical protein